MTVSPPPPPGSQPPDRRPLGFDDLLAIVIAFLAIGGIFFWVLNRTTSRGFDTFSLFSAPLTDSSSSTAPAPGTAAESESESESGLDSPSSAIVADQLLGNQRSNPSLFPFLAAPEADESEERVARRSGQLPAVVPVPVPGESDPAQEGAIAPDSTQSAVTEQPVETGFSDVPSNYWAAPFIAALVERDVINGFPDGTFRPNSPVTRAEFASMVDAAFEQQQPERETQQFGDIPEGFWATEEIDQAYRTGFMQGYPGEVFRPTQQIPKVQTLVSLAQGLGIEQPANPQTTLQTFEDADQIPNWATEQVAAATEAGLVVNYPETQALQPNRDTTRAEVAAIIYQAMTEAGLVEPIESEYVVQPE
jgi:hypothetical protein